MALNDGLDTKTKYRDWEFVVCPMAAATHFRVEFRDGLEVNGKRYNYASADLELNPDTHAWIVIHLYGDLTKAAQDKVVNVLELWAAVHANDHRFRVCRQELQQKYLKVAIDSAQRRLQRANEEVSQAILEVLKTTDEYLNGKECSTCGCLVTKAHLKRVWADDYPYPDAPHCEYCDQELPWAKLFGE